MADWFQAAVAAIVAIFQPIADPSATTASAAYVTQSSSFSAGLAAARAGDVNLALAYASTLTADFARAENHRLRGGLDGDRRRGRWVHPQALGSRPE